MLDKLERRLGHWAVPNLTLIMTGALGVTFGMQLLWPGTQWHLVFSRATILDGELWRLVTFLILAPPWHPLFAAFSLYLFYLMGTALEHEWGAFRFNLFILVGYLATVLAGFLLPGGLATNTFLLGSVFLAFAHLFPDFTLHLFFILPVKIKWLALLTWLLYGWTLLTGSGMERALVLAAVANFLLFFGRDIVLTMKSAKRRMEHQARLVRDEAVPFHRCTTCGATEKTHPHIAFYVCEECRGDHEYCEQHIREHPHR